MSKVEGLKALTGKLQQLEKSKKHKGGSVIVFYATNYAVYVHENLQAAHGKAYNAKHRGEKKFKSRGPKQQAKFLEGPARKYQDEIAADIVRAAKKGVDLLDAIKVGGLRLQRESMKIVPVDQTHLKGSADTKIE